MLVPQISQNRVAAFSDSKRLQSSFANRSAARHRTASLKCKAASESNNSVPTAATTGRIGTITLTEDKETIQDVMAFTGPAPEVSLASTCCSLRARPVFWMQLYAFLFYPPLLHASMHKQSQQ